MFTNCEAFIVFIVIPSTPNNETVESKEEKCKIYGCLKLSCWMEAVEIWDFETLFIEYEFMCKKMMSLLRWKELKGLIVKGENWC